VREKSAFHCVFTGEVIMNRFGYGALFAVATFAILFAGATTERSSVEVLGKPGDGGGCGSSCTVGGHGTGGENSGGAAKGFHESNNTFPEHPGELVDNSGTDLAGHVSATEEASGEHIGSNSGGYARGVDDWVGHNTFSGCNGRESKC
jgi:hypothetical protein